MKNKKIIVISTIVIVAILAILLVLVIVNQDSRENNNGISNDTENLTDLELTGEEYNPSQVYNEENSQVKLSDFSDKPMALLFFNTTELSSYDVIEILQKNYANYKDEINFVNISVIDGVTETKEKVEEFVKTNNITIPVLYDTDYSAKNEYNINTIPTLVFINKNNEIINTVSEDINEDVIQANLDILAENY